MNGQWNCGGWSVLCMFVFLTQISDNMIIVQYFSAKNMFFLRRIIWLVLCYHHVGWSESKHDDCIDPRGRAELGHISMWILPLKLSTDLSGAVFN